MKNNFNLPFNEAIKFAKKKGIVLNPAEWATIWQEANTRAFTVANVTNMDVLANIKNAVDEALQNGTGLNVFVKTLKSQLKDAGWIAPTGAKAWINLPDGSRRKRLTSWRMETIFRTNLQTAYAVGRYKQMQDIVDERPFWRYNAILDNVTRPTHAAQNGKVYPAHSQYWDMWYPPNGFNCRCYVTTLSEREVNQNDVLTKMAVDKPDKGWRYNTGKTALSDYKPDINKLGWDKKAIKTYRSKNK